MTVLSSCDFLLSYGTDPEPEVPTDPEDKPVVDPVDTWMEFNVSIPMPSSENEGDITLLDELHYALYSADAENMSYVLDEGALPVIRDTVAVSDAAAQLGLALSGDMTGKEFVLIAWAQKSRDEGQEFYDLADLRYVTCAGDMTLSNEEERVAYYLTHKFVVAELSHTEDLTMSSPHARLNLGTFAQSLRRPDGSTLRLDQSSVTLSGVSAGFNTIAGLDDPDAVSYGSAGESSSSFTFGMNDVPQKSILIGENESPYVALNYFFADEPVDVDLAIVGTPVPPSEAEVESEEELPQAKFEGSVSRVDVRQGMTTTVIAHFFGSDGRFEYDFRIQIGEDTQENIGNLIIGDDDYDGLFDGDMDWGWTSGDDTPGDGFIGGGDDVIGPGDGDDGTGGYYPGDDEEKENIRIEELNAVTWEVYNREGLYMWANEVRASTTSQRINLKLFADIYLEEKWTPITVAHETNYYGSIDGQGNAIHNLTIESDEDNVGFLARMDQTDNIQVANLSFHNVCIIGGNRTGVVAGTGEALYNCHVMSGTVQGKEMVGGLIGCLIGDADSAPRNCTNYADVSGDSAVGGIVGDENSAVYVYVRDCINYGDVESTGDYVGGICSGASSIYPSGCENHGRVKGANYVGGITGKTLSTGSAKDCINYGEVCGNKYVGGIAGYDDAPNCTNYGIVNGVEYVGGITGFLDGTFAAGSVNHGAVKGETYVGGCAGYAKTSYSPDIEMHYNYGDVYGNISVGGVFGGFGSSTGKNPAIKDFINEGNVYGAENVGGIIGNFRTGKLKLSNNTNTGIITGVTEVAQLIGRCGGTLTDDGTNICNGEVVIVEAEE